MTEKCTETYYLPLVRCKNHTCILDAGHAGKHDCACGVKWTKDPKLAGDNWSNSVTLYDGLNHFKKPKPN